MSSGGFAIRCPSCHEWSTYETAPGNIVVSSIGEFDTVIRRFQKANEEREIFKEPRLIRCRSPRLFCPAPFEAIIYKSGNKDFEELKVPQSWSSTRHFRLYKNDRQSRWDDENEEKYCAILFNTQPVQRLRHIELESLMNRKLVSLLIAGMCVEIDTPLTFFAANIFESGEKDGDSVVRWVPIEGYSQDQEKLVPPHYNNFCRICRDISMRKLVAKFNSDKENIYNVVKCKLPFVRKGKCGGRAAACMKETPDWDQCPAFLRERNEKCPCYNSDLMLIDRVKELWLKRKFSREGVSHICHAGFREIGFPIEVHGHLVGVAVTGQLFSRADEIKSAGDFIKSKKVHSISSLWDTLEGEEDVLDEARQILIGLELRNKKNGQKTVFLADGPRVKEKIERLLPNLKRFEESAESHYRDFRARSEFAFRQELFGYVENNITQMDFFGKKIQYVLKRMQEFWAFKGAYLLNYSFATQRVSTIAVSVLGHAEAFGISQTNGCKLGTQWKQFHPYPYLGIRGSEPHSVSFAFNQAIPKIQEVVDQNNKSRNLEIRNGDCEFAVIVPTFRGVYIFVFAVRDQRKVCSLESRSPGGISILCQDMIFETCCEIVGEFHNVWEFVERDKQVQIECLENLDRTIEKEIGQASDDLGIRLESMRNENDLVVMREEMPKVEEGLARIAAVPGNRIREELTRLRSSG